VPLASTLLLCNQTAPLPLHTLRYITYLTPSRALLDISFFKSFNTVVLVRGTIVPDVLQEEVIDQRWTRPQPPPQKNLTIVGGLANKSDAQLSIVENVLSLITTPLS